MKSNWDMQMEMLGYDPAGNPLQRKKEKRPEILPKPATVYEHEYSEIPERIRVSFSDGRTAVYELRVDQPHPLVIKNIEIMKETKKKITMGYVNQPEIRRRRK